MRGVLGVPIWRRTYPPPRKAQLAEDAISPQVWEGRLRQRMATGSTAIKTVLITGANRGIGLEHARRYAERGAKVWATARAPDEADDLAALSRAHQDRFEILAYDATAPDAAQTLKARLGDT